MESQNQYYCRLIYTHIKTKATKKCNGMKSETYREKQKITKKQIHEQHRD